MKSLYPVLLLKSIVLLAPGASAATEQGVRLPDPTKPANYFIVPEASDLQTTDGGLKVQKIFISNKGSSAVINGKRVVVGDSVAGAVVERIESGGVLLRTGNELNELRIFPSLKN